MGISLFHAELIIQEHLFKPLPKTVHLLGRQTVLFDIDTAIDLLRKYHISPPTIEYKRDTTTVGSKNTPDTAFISDETFFKMLGVIDVKAIDHSFYEGADILCDLNKPLPAHLEQHADFIFGGSVLDNIFDPASYIQNINRLLKPGGRLIDQNIISFHHHPYILATPAWYFDYFVLNNFVDCKIYFGEFSISHANIYGLEVEANDPIVCDFGSPGLANACGVVVIAEKSADSSWDKVPSQDQYRDQEQWKRFRKNLDTFKKSTRKWKKFANPTNDQLITLPIRKIKSFLYLGTYYPFFESTEDLSEEKLDSNLRNQGICVIEATYGWNNLRSMMKIPSVFPLCIGNATEQISAKANGSNGISFDIDVTQLGDPAPGLGKDLRLLYYYGQDPDKKIHEIYIEQEAHGKRLVIPPFSSS